MHPAICLDGHTLHWKPPVTYLPPCGTGSRHEPHAVWPAPTSSAHVKNAAQGGRTGRERSADLDNVSE